VIEIRKAIGLMSGTSLDGIDLAYCLFWEDHNQWHFKIEVAETIPYSAFWKDQLGKAHEFSGFELTELHARYGNFVGKCAHDFIAKHNIQPDLIASHGHTVFHQPQSGFTLQIGSGAHIAAATKLPVVCDFRSSDVALGGQGAPLVPFGDRHLFGDFASCLNIGGFANISYESENTRIAFDICPANIALNHFSNKLGLDFDKDGKIAKSGKMNQSLFDELNSLPFYDENHPKSLGREWFEAIFLPIIEKCNLSVADILRTLVEHIAFQIGKANTAKKQGEMLVTGGGAENGFLIDKIQSFTHRKIVVPPLELVRYKEALVFAFLGLMRFENKANCLSSATGAKADSCCGAVYRV
jgi:anhydro-N-acetylmuramic acid kinase